MCKQRVTRPNPDHSESEEEEEEEEVEVTARRRDPEGGGGGEGDSERTPLLRPPNPGSPSGSLASSYCATVSVTTAQCLAPSPRCDSPLLGYQGYYSPEESSDSEGEETGEAAQPTEDDTARLLGRGGLDV